MSFKNFVPAIWAAAILEPLEKALVFAAPDAVNRDYEGEIAQAGDRVVINTISDPTIAPYTPNSTVITPEELTSADQELIIDQSPYFAFKVDDVDKRQSAGGGRILTTALRRAAYKLRDEVDRYVAGLYVGAQSDNKINTTSITTPALALQYLSELGVKLDEANVPSEGRFVIVPPWYHGLLRRDSAFTDLAGAPGYDALINGLVGRAEGFNVKVSNNVTKTTGDDYRVCAGVDMAISYAQQMSEVEAYRPESSFSDAVKGLLLYGAKLIRPDAIATLIASKT